MTRFGLLLSLPQRRFGGGTLGLKRHEMGRCPRSLKVRGDKVFAAMATCSTNNVGFDPTQVAQMPADQTLQTAIAASWHA
jgi:hypothetical protein